MDKIHAALVSVVSYILLVHPAAISAGNCFDEQVKRVVRAATATPERLRALVGVRRAVETALRTVWPGSVVKLFGSLSTGLGSPTSDLDLSVFLPESVHPDYDVINKATNVFQSSPYTYQQLHKRSRLLALTLYYTPANVTCDIHFRIEPFEVIESGLLHYLLHIDERALNLAIIVKYWAKLHQLIHKKYLTSYGMMMLVIYFLQQRSILPSVVELQKNIPVETLYNATFDMNFEKNIISNDNETLYEIIGAFFEYFENFDFDRFVVSPFVGRAIDKSLFRYLETVPDEFLMYKRNVANNITMAFNITALCIQSLIKNDNCAWRVDRADRFVMNFRNAAKSYKKNEECSFLRSLGVNVGW